jgi:hypothetical protein
VIHGVVQAPPRSSELLVEVLSLGTEYVVAAGRALIGSVERLRGHAAHRTVCHIALTRRLGELPVVHGFTQYIAGMRSLCGQLYGAVSGGRVGEAGVGGDQRDSASRGQRDVGGVIATDFFSAPPHVWQ